MYACKICGKEFGKWQSLAAHVGHHSEKKIACEKCGKMLSSAGVRGHLLWHKNDRNCLYCGKIVWGGKSFCNRTCSCLYLNKGKVKKKGRCRNCDKEIDRGFFCSVICQVNAQHAKYIEEWLTGKKTGNQSEDAVSHHIRKWLMERSGGKCEQCGWNKVNPYTGKIPLTVHHKDGDSCCTTPDNIELICPCCHSLTKTYGGLNRGRGRKSRREKRQAGMVFNGSTTGCQSVCTGSNPVARSI